MQGAKLFTAHLEGAFLVGADLEGATLCAALLQRAELNSARLSGADLGGANLDGANLGMANLAGAHLHGARLEHANLGGSILTGAHFKDAQISGKTRLEGIEFGPNHKAMHDGSESLRFPARDRYLTWGHLRSIGTLPLFGASYAVLGGTLALINGLDFLNTEFGWTLTPPTRTMWLTLSSLFLVIGTTIYKVACPKRVQSFSETEWVEEHGKPRLQYLAESLKRRWQISALAFTGVGGLLGVTLLAERLWVAFWYLVFVILLNGMSG